MTGKAFGSNQVEGALTGLWPWSLPPVADTQPASLRENAALAGKASGSKHGQCASTWNLKNPVWPASHRQPVRFDLSLPSVRGGLDWVLEVPEMPSCVVDASLSIIRARSRLQTACLTRSGEAEDHAVLLLMCTWYWLMPTKSAREIFLSAWGLWASVLSMMRAKARM